MLYIVPTPVGNMDDITLRAIKVLQSAQLILAEDTRTSSHLLRHHQIQNTLTPYHQHNEHKVAVHIADQIAAGKTVALISDAGTPGISDPGYLLIKECIDRNIEVQCLPGATAFVPALVCSGLSTHAFCFEGFPPVKKGRHTLFSRLAAEPRTIILYESPVRLPRTLQDIATYFGADRKISVSREISKMFEEHRRGSVSEVLAHFQQKPAKGEIVICIAGTGE